MYFQFSLCDYQFIRCTAIPNNGLALRSSLPLILTGTHSATSSHHRTFAGKVLNTCEVLNSSTKMAHLQENTGGTVQVGYYQMSLITQGII